MALEWHGDLVTRTIKARSAKASQKIAELILAKSQEFVPVDTGDLKRSGHIEVGGDGIDSDDLSTYRTVVYDRPYARIQEEGSAKQVGRFYLSRAILFVRADAGRIMKTIWGWK